MPEQEFEANLSDFVNLCDFQWHYPEGDQGWMTELLEPQNLDGIINFLSTGGSQNLDN